MGVPRRDMKYSLKKKLLRESSDIQNLATLLTTSMDSVYQGVSVGEILDLVRKFESYPLPFDEGYTIEIETNPDLCAAIKQLKPPFLEIKKRPDGWCLLLYVVPESAR